MVSVISVTTSSGADTPVHLADANVSVFLNYFQDFLADVLMEHGSILIQVWSFPVVFLDVLPILCIRTFPPFDLILGEPLSIVGVNAGLYYSVCCPSCYEWMFFDVILSS